MNEKNKKLLFILIFFAILYIIFQITVPTGHTIQNVQPTFSWHNQFVKNEHKLSTNKSPLENYSSELIRLERLVNHLKNSKKKDIIDRLAILHAYEHGALEIMRIVIKYDKNQLQVSNIADFAEFSSKFENLKKIVKIKKDRK